MLNGLFNDKHDVTDLADLQMCLFNGKCDVIDLADLRVCQLQGRSTVNPGSPRQKNRLNAINLLQVSTGLWQPTVSVGASPR